MPLAQASIGALREAFAALDARCGELMATESVRVESIERRYYADVCYVGQSYHLEVAVDLETDALDALKRKFYAAHDRVYGHSVEGAVQFVNLRAVHQAHQSQSADKPLHPSAAGGAAKKGTRRILTELSGGFVDAAVYARARLAPGTTFVGPAIVEQADTSTGGEPGWRARIDAHGSLILDRHSREGKRRHSREEKRRHSREGGNPL
jgi:N-methylhydantoinase A